jgi:hypothetical protein
MSVDTGAYGRAIESRWLHTYYVYILCIHRYGIRKKTIPFTSWWRGVVGIVSVNGTEDHGFGSRQGKRFFWTAYIHVSAVHCNLIQIVVVVYAFE